MGETLTEQRRVRDEGLRVVKRCDRLGNTDGVESRPPDRAIRKQLLTTCQQQR
jgi:hypothetical protein